MKQNVTKEEIVSQLVKVFRSNEVATYNSANECRQGICGWCGVMAPLSRPAYIADFGLETVIAAETEARYIIQADSLKYQASEFHAHEIEADNHKAMGQPAPQEGSFMWAVYSGLKCDGGKGIYDELKGKLYDEEKLCTSLVKVEKVYHVSKEEFKAPGTADEIARREDCPGGWSEENGDYLDKDRMHFLHTGAVVAPDGRYYLIDNEGYDYARYVLTPLAWRDMFSEEVAEIEERKRKEAEEMARQAEEARQKRLDAYRQLCGKWEGLMTEITPYEEEAERLHREKGWGSKEYKTAERKLHNIRRANILTMCKAAFPEVKFSLRKNSGWGSDWEVSWEDGPTEETFGEKTNLELFSTYHDTFNGYDDSTDVSYEEFTEFAFKYMGNCNSIKTNREMSESKRAELIAEVINVVPKMDDKNTYGCYNRCGLDAGQLEALQEHFDVCLSQTYKDPTAEEIARVVWSKKDYLAAEVTTVSPESKPQIIGNGKLELIDYSEKAIALVGDTKPLADKLKKLGGKFNSKLRCGAGWIFSKKKESELRTAFDI